MVFIGEFYIAHDDDTQLETIDNFMNDDTYKSLLIIDSSMAIENIKNLRGGYNCFVCFLNHSDDPSKESRKIIYINNVFDDMAQNFMLNHGGLLAFF